MGLAGVSDTGFAVYGLSHGTYGVRGDSVGTGYGIYGYNSGTGYAGYFNGDVTVTGQLKGSDTYLWVPGTAGIAATTLGVNVETWYYGRVALKTSAAGDNRYFYFPVSIPGQLYGQNVTVEQLTVYYYTSNSASYINSTTMYKLTGAATAESIASDTTNHASTSATSYSVTTTGNRTLSSASGPLNIRLQLYFGSTSHTIYIGGVRLRLSHTS